MFRKSNVLMYDVGFRVVKNKKDLKYVQKTLAFKDIPKGKLVKGDVDMRIVEDTSKKYLELMYKQHEIAVEPMRFVLSDYADQGINVDALYDLIEKRCTQE